MKMSRFLSGLSLALLSCIPATLPAAETVKIEAVLYLFKSNSIPRIDFSKALSGPAPLSGDGIVISPPAVIDFDREELALNGAVYTWNGGPVVPPRFNSDTKLPTIIALAGQPATIRIAVPVQFLEKLPDGSLKLREIAGDLPDIPHYLLTFDARPATNGPSGYDLIVSCRMDIATMQRREKIPGIDLEVGRPVTSRFESKVEYWGKTGEWFGIMTGQKESGDYNLLTLIKVSPADPAAHTLFVPPSKPGPAAPPAAFSLAAGLAVSANGVTDLWLGLDRRSRAAWPPTRSNPGVRFGLKLQGAGPVYRKFEVSRHGSETSSVHHEGTVTIDPKHQWVVIDLQEVVSKRGEPRRTEPCEANGRYPVEEVRRDHEGWQSNQGLMTPNSGPKPAELAVPYIPNGPPMQPR